MMVYTGNTVHIKNPKNKFSYDFYEKKSRNPKIVARNSVRSPKSQLVYIYVYELIGKSLIHSLQNTAAASQP